MRKVLALLLALLLAPSLAWATAFTSAGTGNWNDPTKWTGGTGSNFPSAAGDTATITAQNVMTIPSGVTIDVGAITTSAGINTARTTVQINGTLNIHANMVLATQSALRVGPGGILDLLGNSIAPAAIIEYSFLGTSDSHATIRSTGSLGTFLSPGANRTVTTFVYADISGMNAPVFGRNQVGVGGIQSYTNSTFTGNKGPISLDETGNQTTQSIIVDFCDFRDPVDADPVAANAYQPNIVNTSTVTTGVRRITNSTFNTSGANNGVTFFNAGGFTFSGNVFSNWLMNTLIPTMTFNGNFFANFKYTDQDNVYFKGSGGGNDWTTFTNNYGYYNAGDHPTGFQVGTAGTKTVTGNVFENDTTPALGKGANWLLWAPTSTGSWVVKQNLFLGPGTPTQSVVSSTISPTLWDFGNNTTLVNNNSTDPLLPSLFNTEGGGTLIGTVNIYNWLVVNPTPNPTTVAVSLNNSATGQIQQLDYNVGWTYPAGPTIPPVLYDSSVVATGGNGPHDFSTDPNFVDRTRNLAKWDASLGGPGTVAHAITQLLTMTGNLGTAAPGYTPAALVAYVRAGFVPRNSRLIGTGLSGANIGALTPLPTPTIFYRQGGRLRFAN